MNHFQSLISTLERKENLSEEEVRSFLNEDINTEEQIALLQALQEKGVMSDELFFFVSELQKQAVQTVFPNNTLDICGTGGSGLSRINTSTLSAFILAACDVPIVKHGNRAASGRFGSFDLLESLGIKIEQKPEHLQYLFWKFGLAFAFAPHLHPAMGKFKEARQKLGTPSVFNLLGPLLSPANPAVQLIGTSYPDSLELLAQTTQKMGKEHVLIIRGQDGLDEVTLSAPTDVVELKNGKIKSYQITPEDFGLSPTPLEEILAETKEEKIELAESILQGKCKTPHQDLVLINVATALYLAGKTWNLHTGYKMAKEMLLSGKVYDLFLQYRDTSNNQNILTEIVGHKTSEVASLPAKYTKLKPSTKDFRAALLVEGLSVIAEVKKASPSKGLICPDFDPVRIAQAYENQGARAISVLCDEQYFQGNYEYLRQVAESVNLPILCKEFIIDPRQIRKARECGADAVLLIAAVLSSDQIEALIQEAKKYGMDALVEVHNEDELQQVLTQTSAEIIGINNRNLKDFSVDLKTTQKLIESLPPKHREELIFVAESGIHTSEDIHKLPRATSAILVGEGVVSHPEKIELLINTRPLVKICGVKTKKDVEACLHAGTDMVGLNFVPSSSRFLTLDKAKKLLPTNPKLKTVGIFQDQLLKEVNAIAESLKLDFIQLSGMEDMEYVRQCCRPVIKGVRLETSGDITRAREYVSNIAYILFESSHPGKGQSISHKLLEQVDFPYLLSGGLTPENVGELVQKYHPRGVDVASGVEEKGIKSEQKIYSFIQHVS